MDQSRRQSLADRRKRGAEYEGADRRRERPADVGIEVEWGDDLLVVRLSNPLISDNLLKFQKVLEAVCKKPRPAEVVVDVANVPYMDSKAVGLIVEIHTQLKGQNRRLVIENPQQYVRRFFNTLRVDKVLEIRVADGGGSSKDKTSG